MVDLPGRLSRGDRRSQRHRYGLSSVFAGSTRARRRGPAADGHIGVGEGCVAGWGSVAGPMGGMGVSGIGRRHVLRACQVHRGDHRHPTRVHMGSRASYRASVSEVAGRRRRDAVPAGTLKAATGGPPRTATRGRTSGLSPAAQEEERAADQDDRQPAHDPDRRVDAPVGIRIRRRRRRRRPWRRRQSARPPPPGPRRPRIPAPGPSPRAEGRGPGHGVPVGRVTRYPTVARDEVLDLRGHGVTVDGGSPAAVGESSASRTVTVTKFWLISR